MTVVPFKQRSEADAPPKKFFWSYSRLKNYETCPKKYLNVDVLKAHREPPSKKLNWGSEVHEQLAIRLANKTPLPITMKRFEEECLKIEEAAFNMQGELLVELELAIDNQFQASAWDDHAVTWFRAKVDAMIVAGSHAIAFDWKTGKFIEDIPQLALTAQAIFANYPNVDFVGTRYIWLDDPVHYTDRYFDWDRKSEAWNDVWPRLQLLMNAHATNVFPARECWACARNCPVPCQFNGREK